MRLEKHDNHCKSIADTLETIAGNNMAICPDCGGWMNLSGVDDVVTDHDTGADVAQCPDCGAYHDVDELAETGEFVTLWDYFDDFLDAKFTVDFNLDYSSVSVMIAFGGPNIYVDTNTGSVELYWWNETGSYPLRRFVVDEIDAYFCEMYEMKR